MSVVLVRNVEGNVNAKKMEENVVVMKKWMKGR
jgi:hypothetical protein